jgi:uncharacterized protein YndB with AHSA1/START domain
VTEPIRIEFEVACSPAHAFDTWASKTSMWWPRSHSMSSAPGLVVTFESRPGGRIYERTPDGTEHDWGEVLAWEPPRRLAYLWHLGTDRSRATEVDISFTGGGDAGTTVTIVHRGWERLGADGPAWRQRNLGGWSGLLPLPAGGSRTGRCRVPRWGSLAHRGERVRRRLSTTPLPHSP